MTKKEFVYTGLRKIIKNCFFLLFSFALFFALAHIDKTHNYQLTGSDWTVLVLCMIAFIVYDILKLRYEMEEFDKKSNTAVPFEGARDTQKKEFVLAELKKLVSDCINLTVIVLVVRIAADTILRDGNSMASNISFLVLTYFWRAVLFVVRIVKSA